MAAIITRKDKHGKTRYQVIIRLKGYPTQTATFERITDAKRWAQHIESAIRENRHFKTSESKKHTFGEMIDRYLFQFNLENCRKHQLFWWKNKYKAYLLSDITPALIAEGRDELLKGLTKRRV
jgi:hypothetical protein